MSIELENKNGSNRKTYIGSFVFVFVNYFWKWCSITHKIYIYIFFKLIFFIENVFLYFLETKLFFFCFLDKRKFKNKYKWYNSQDIRRCLEYVDILEDLWLSCGWNVELKFVTTVWDYKKAKTLFIFWMLKRNRSYWGQK